MTMRCELLTSERKICLGSDNISVILYASSKHERGMTGLAGLSRDQDEPHSSASVRTKAYELAKTAPPGRPV